MLGALEIFAIESAQGVASLELHRQSGDAFVAQIKRNGRVVTLSLRVIRFSDDETNPGVPGSDRIVKITGVLHQDADPSALRDWNQHTIVLILYTDASWKLRSGTGYVQSPAMP